MSIHEILETKGIKVFWTKKEKDENGNEYTYVSAYLAGERDLTEKRLFTSYPPMYSFSPSPIRGRFDSEEAFIDEMGIDKPYFIDFWPLKDDEDPFEVGMFRKKEFGYKVQRYKVPTCEMPLSSNDYDIKYKVVDEKVVYPEY